MKSKSGFLNADEPRRTMSLLVVIFLAVGLLLLCLGGAVSNTTIGPRTALLFSPDGHVTQRGLEGLKVGGARLQFLGTLVLSCGIILLGTTIAVHRFVARSSMFTIGHAFANVAIDIKWDRIFGAIAIIYLCIMLIAGVICAPFSVDGPLLFDGAKSLLHTGNILPYDGGGIPIEARKWVPLSFYLPKLLCVTVGGGLISAKALYAALCIFCILGLGYTARQAFGKRAAGFAIFVASLAPVVHTVAVDSARVEFLGTTLLFLGIVILYQHGRKYRRNLLLACFLIGLSTWNHPTLLVIMPAFVITGLLSGTNDRWRNQALSFTLGPVVGFGAFFLLDLVIKSTLFGGKATLLYIFSYWFTSGVHGTLGSLAVPLAYKLSVINSIVALPVFAGIIVAAGFLLIKEKFNDPLRLFVFLAAFGWIAWWLIFDCEGNSRHLLTGFLFFCIIMGGFCAEVMRGLGCLFEGRKNAFLNESSILWPRAYGSLSVILVMTLVVFAVNSIDKDMAWLNWASPMRKGQEQMAEYVAANKDQIVFCSWGQITAYDISALSNVPLWDVSRGLPSDSLRRSRGVQIIVTAWQKKEFALGFEGGLFPGEKDLIESKCRLIKSIGGNDVYEVIEDIGN